MYLRPCRHLPLLPIAYLLSRSAVFLTSSLRPADACIARARPAGRLGLSIGSEPAALTPCVLVSSPRNWADGPPTPLAHAAGMIFCYIWVRQEESSPGLPRFGQNLLNASPSQRDITACGLDSCYPAPFTARLRTVKEPRISRVRTSVSNGLPETVDGGRGARRLLVIPGLLLYFPKEI
ncbi:hypothetical protein PYCCODRAFT_1432282 [Trametes coccinea BRFM310]|uniref:Uncharacterized protein n=1 Tax=Trametes coccinea (strain BRFM310) TaxID=1353009 RepID=A0A1Y2IXD2_TRAC3|nr:hypothetical protein PYCCODRAFT_1432282 [Trametes coccinea BRFM310]